MFRSIHKVSMFNVLVTVAHNRETSEYRVKIDCNPEADYFTDDRQDAFDTAERMIRDQFNINLTKALFKLKSLMSDGWEYPDASAKAATLFKVSQTQLGNAYDAQ